MNKISLRKKCALAAAIIGLSLPVCSYAQSTQEDEIVVTGTPLGQSLDDALVGTSVLKGEDLANRQTSSSNIGEVLKAEPGVSSTFFGAGASRPIIRGQGAGRVQVLSNGIGEIDASATSPDHAVAAEPALATRIEVVRGAGVLRYGSAGSGGVVNVIDGRIPETAPTARAEGVVRVSSTSADNGYEGAAGVNLLVGRVAAGDVVLHLEGTWRKTDDYQIPGFARSAQTRALQPAASGETQDRGLLDNSATRSASGATGLSLIGEQGRLGVSVKRLESLYGVPGDEGNVVIDLAQTRVDFNGRLEPVGGPLEAVNVFLVPQIISIQR